MVWPAVVRGGSIDGHLEWCQSVSSADVRSVQCLELPDIPGAFEQWGSEHNLEFLLHRYFAVAARTVWPFVGVRWRAHRPTLTFAGLIPLIVMGAASIESTAEQRAISVTVEGGILVKVASDARLTLSLDAISRWSAQRSSSWGTIRASATGLLYAGSTQPARRVCMCGSANVSCISCNVRGLPGQPGPSKHSSQPRRATDLPIAVSVDGFCRGGSNPRSCEHRCCLR